VWSADLLVFGEQPYRVSLGETTRHYIQSTGNQGVKRSGKPRLVVWGLPKRSPWLNPIELHWFHAKKAYANPLTMTSHLTKCNIVCFTP
jgi:hypothetical protein